MVLLYLLQTVLQFLLFHTFLYGGDISPGGGDASLVPPEGSGGLLVLPGGSDRIFICLNDFKTT